MASVKTPADLLSAIPFLVGFHPAESLVVVSVSNDDTLDLAMRLDFPALDGKLPQLGEALIAHLNNNNASGVLLVGYTDTPKASLVMNILATAIGERFNLRESMLVANNRYRSLICQDETCCPAEGNPMPDFKSSALTAEQVANGKVLPYENTEALVASIQPNAMSMADDFISLVKSYTEISEQDGARAVQELADQALAGEVISTDLKAKVLGAIQTHVQVRDYALGVFNNSEVAEVTYLDLAKSAPVGFVAPATALASAFVYENGNGAMAHRLLDRAIEADPEYSLARLLRRVFSAGWPPAGFAQLRSELHGKVIENIFGNQEAK